MTPLDVTVAVATFGGAEWVELARRAIASAEPQAPVVHVHGETLAGARNAALAQVDTEFVIHLDADDTLAPDYVERMAAGTADLRAPSVSYVSGGHARAPYVPRVPGHRHDCEGACLPMGNFIVVGACARASMLRAVGGWWDEDLYEDWSSWLRMHVAGATVESIPEAVYIATAHPGSRNRAPARDVKEHWHRVIYDSVFAT